MPLLGLDEIQNFSSFFRGKCGTSIAKWIMDAFSVNYVNDLNDRNECDDAPTFCRDILEDVGVNELIGNAHLLDKLPDGPFITISNHPYGSIDGIMLIDLFGHLRDDYKVMVNKFLYRIRSMRDSFISVVPPTADTNGISQDSIEGVKKSLSHVREGHPMGFFPAGAVSNFTFSQLGTEDRQWQESVVRLIKKMHLPIVPVRFFDRNSAFFYFLGLINWKLRVLRLPHEVRNKKGHTARIGIGETISIEMQDLLSDIREYGSFLRSAVYDMPMPKNFVSRSELAI